MVSQTENIVGIHPYIFKGYHGGLNSTFMEAQKAPQI